MTKKTEVKVPVELLIEEKAKIADELVEFRDEIGTLTEKMKETTAKSKKEIAIIEGKVSYHYKCLKIGHKDVMMKCDIVKNFDSGFKEYHTKDGKVHEIPLVGDDYQLETDDKTVGNVPDEIPEDVQI